MQIRTAIKGLEDLGPSVERQGHIMITVVGFVQVPLSAIFSRAQPCGIDYVHAVIIVAVTGFEPVLLVSKTRMLTITPYRYFNELI